MAAKTGVAGREMNKEESRDRFDYSRPKRGPHGPDQALATYK